MIPRRAVVSVPCSTSNLGPGFDGLGLALSWRSRVTVEVREGECPPMAAEAVRAFFRVSHRKPFPVSARVAGGVPPARGLGSSAVLRVGVLWGMNALAGRPLKAPDLLRLAVVLEGHPENVAASAAGGCVVCARTRFGLRVMRMPPPRGLVFVAAIPERIQETGAARRALPRRVSFEDAMLNATRAAALTAALGSGRVDLLPGLFDDRLHQPARARLMPYLPRLIATAERAGALGGFLSGSGSTVIAACAPPRARRVSIALKRAMGRMPGEVRILRADARGAEI